MSKTIAIMQPTYLPWLGYLAMIEEADRFVFLDSVQFEHRSWQQRNRIKTHDGKELWLTIAVKQKGLSTQKINEVMCLDLAKDMRRHLSSLSHFYRKAECYGKFYSELSFCMQKSVMESQGLLADYNIAIINFLCRYSGINKQFIRSSQLPVSGQKGELLANICEHLGGDVYLSAPGSSTYLNDCPAFGEKKVQIVYHEYLHSKYHQLFGDFLPSMSCVDAFFNVKRENLKPLIMSGCL